MSGVFGVRMGELCYDNLKIYYLMEMVKWLNYKYENYFKFIIFRYMYFYMILIVVYDKKEKG